MRHLCIFVVTVLTVVIPRPALAQRHIKGQWGITPVAGVMDRLPLGSLRAPGQGVAAGLDLLRYGKKERYWKVGYLYDRKYYDALGQTLSTDRHTLVFSVAPFQLANKSRSFYLVPVVGVYGGFERINRNVRDLPEGRLLNVPTGLAGVQAGLEGEFYLTSQTALYASWQTRYLPFSTLSQFRTFGLLGVRFTFFNP